MSYTTESVILIGKKRTDLSDHFDEDALDQMMDNIGYAMRFDGDTGFIGFTFSDESFTQDSLDFFIATAKEDFVCETGVEAEIFLVASWS